MQDLVPVFSVPATYEEFLAQDDSTINKLTGQTSEGAGNFLPRLSINYDAEFVSDTDRNADPITLPRGHWKFPVTLENGTTVSVFAKEAQFRPFIQAFRYSVYDADENKNVLISTPFNDWGQPIVDTDGNEFKAGQYKKKVIAKYPQYANTLKCERLLYGLTTISGKDMNGNAAEAVNVPSVWRTRGSAFMPVDDALKSLSKENKKMFMWPMHLTTKREKNGGTTFFVPIIEFKNEVKFPKEEFEFFRSFGEVIKGETEVVVAQYKKIITKKKDDKFTKEFAKGNLKDDFGDDLDEMFEAAGKAA